MTNLATGDRHEGAASALQSTVPPAASSKVQAPMRRSVAGLWYVTPSLVLLGVAVVAPIVMSAYYSFTDYSLLRSPSWVGTENYSRLLVEIGRASGRGRTVGEAVGVSSK